MKDENTEDLLELDLSESQALFDDLNKSMSDKEILNHMEAKNFLYFSFFTMFLWSRKHKRNNILVQLSSILPLEWSQNEALEEIG